MPVFNRNRHSGSSGVADAAYVIENSIRFNNDDSAAMSRSGSTGESNDKIVTVSFWVKRANITASPYGDGVQQRIFSVQGQDVIAFGPVDQLQFAFANGAGNIETNRKFRDSSAWYHIVCLWNTPDSTAGDRMRVWVNGVEETAFSTDVQPSLNQAVTMLWTAVPYYIGTHGSGSYLDGYLAQFALVDGTAYTASDFGESDDNGNWVPIDITELNYGNKGWLLDFAVAPGTDNGAGTDVSGNAQHFTDVNLAANDQMLDSPTDDADNDVGNFGVMNPLDVEDTHTASNGNLKVISTSGTGGMAGSFGMTSGKWYVEATSLVGGDARIGIRICNSAFIDGGSNPATGWLWHPNTAETEHGGSTTSYGTASSVGQVVMLAIDMDNQELYIGREGTWFNSSDPAARTNPAFTDLPTTDSVQVYQNTGSGGHGWEWNFGQHTYAHTIPVGFKRLHTGNLAAPTITDPSKFFQVDTFSGTGSELVRTLTDAAGSAVKPDLVWIKDRDTVVEHVLTDSARGATIEISSNDDGLNETVAQGLKSFDTSGYTLGTDSSYNASSSLNVAWCWVAGSGAGSSNEDGSINTVTTTVNQTAGFSISTYVGTFSGATVGHGLGAVPEMIIVKKVTVGDGWVVYHKDNSSAPETDHLHLDTNVATADEPHWNDTSPTSTVFSLGVTNQANSSGQTHVAYCWAGVEGYSKFGGYTGNAAADGTFVYTGFRPAYILTKASGATGAWNIHDFKREGYNVDNDGLEANSTDAESTYDGIDILSNGFKLRNTGHPNTATSYIFAAFASAPFGGDGVSQARAR